MVDERALSQAVSDAVNAVRDDHTQRVTPALVALAQFSEDSVIEELLGRVFDAAHGSADVAVPATTFLPEPEHSKILLQGVVAGDLEALLRWSDRDPGTLVGGLVGLAAALTPEA
jgi:hypothetical protein